MTRTRVKTYRHRIGKNQYLVIQIYPLASAHADTGNALATNALNIQFRNSRGNGANSGGSPAFGKGVGRYEAQIFLEQAKVEQRQNESQRRPIRSRLDQSGRQRDLHQCERYRRRTHTSAITNDRRPGRGGDFDCAAHFPHFFFRHSIIMEEETIRSNRFGKGVPR
ncbi:hypothetical protein [Cohnella sp.]|uniref:hypothetical protein n=1 Tax=Cohnella sp. TaxID=1883426 RepID=UPI0025800E68|nr:hypothetical protein [Cohnella sp.]